MRLDKKHILITVTSLVAFAGIVFSLPSVLTWTLSYKQAERIHPMLAEFPVTVDPRNKTIVEDKTVNDFLESADSPLQASAVAGGGIIWKTFERIAVAIANAPWYQSIASVGSRFVTVDIGTRKEEVASAFAKALGWDAKQKQTFITAAEHSLLPLPEGSYSSGIYVVYAGTSPEAAQAQINERFIQDVLSHYSSSTEQVIPLNDALTVASLIQRETIGHDDMRLISGIIWNRIFSNMKLQLDATLQYAKASKTKTGAWWPKVLPSDKYIKSAYNTYQHVGLPPTPIASPSVAAIIAALNPIKTDCLYYFHDDNGDIHCTPTYKEHVALLKQIYGKGK